jgi:TRAP-type C4-dicarboxylate transport system permease large subunit
VACVRIEKETQGMAPSTRYDPLSLILVVLTAVAMGLRQPPYGGCLLLATIVYAIHPASRPPAREAR